LQLSARLQAFTKLFGAHHSPELREHELDRAFQRIVGCSGCMLVWAFAYVSGQLSPPRAVLLGLAALYLSGSLLYAVLLRRGRVRGALPVYAFLVLDPFLLVLILYLDPRNFAFMCPLLVAVIVRAGLSYGVRTMVLSWTIALLSSCLLLTSAFWHEKVELTLAYFLMLALVPAFFSPVVRRIHGARTIEEERARLAARHEDVIARSAFLAKVSHELRSPLQGIVSALDVLALRSGPKANEEDEMIRRIRRSSLLLNTLLRDLLTLAKGEAGHLELRPEPFDACALVESVAASALDLAREKNLELIVERPAGALFVIADSARIDQILTNLIINSIRYTDAGQVRLTLHPYSADKRALEFVVADSGPGIAEAMLPALLAPDRAISGSERRGEGSGIGLAIVRTLVDHLGGSVAVASRLGRGTTFTIDIPAEPVASDDAARAPESRSP
jgi:signal transduction histidine kinase